MLLLTYPGAPSIYYGSEIGVEGGMPDKWARRSFPWDKPETWNTSLRENVKQLIALRHAHPALRDGSYQALWSSETSYAFVRERDGARMVVAINTGSTSNSGTLPIGTDVQPEFTLGEAALSSAGDVTLGAQSAGIWEIARG